MTDEEITYKNVVRPETIDLIDGMLREWAFGMTESKGEKKRRLTWGAKIWLLMVLLTVFMIGLSIHFFFMFGYDSFMMKGVVYGVIMLVLFQFIRPREWTEERWF